jgi:RNA polymerase sigma factor (TIGR02999 family)
MNKLNEVSQVLADIRGGELNGIDRLLPLVYDELRRIARAKLRHETTDHMLQPTALVHEAYIRLVDVSEQQAWDSNAHFFSAAAEAMRRILVEHARQKSRLKRGGNYRRIPFDDEVVADVSQSDELLAVNELIEEFAIIEPEKAKLVKLRYFVGFSLEECASILGVSRATVSRHWQFSRAWLFHRLQTRA